MQRTCLVLFVWFFIGVCYFSESNLLIASFQDGREQNWLQMVQEVTLVAIDRISIVEGLDECRQVLRQHNLMPPPPPHTSVSDQNSAPATRFPSIVKQTTELQDDS